MADILDCAQEYAASHAESAVAAHAGRVRTVGLTHCEEEDCGAPIAPTRTADGARRCVTCQSEHEAQSGRFKTWGRK